MILLESTQSQEMEGASGEGTSVPRTQGLNQEGKGTLPQGQRPLSTEPREGQRERGRGDRRCSLEPGQVSFTSGHCPSSKELSPAVCNWSQETLLPAPTAHGAEL